MNNIRLLAIVVGMLFMLGGNGLACSDFILPEGKDSSAVISGRTMDFDVGYATWIIKIPVGQAFSGSAPGKDGAGKGVHWTVEHGYVSLSILPSKYDLKKDRILPSALPVSEGMNTAGLSVGALWLSYAGYEQVKPGEACPNCLDVPNLMAYVLGTCATVDDAIAKLNNLRVWIPEKVKESNVLHLSIHDASGSSIVVEYIDGKQIIYKNEIGVLANEPPYDWQLTNYNLMYASLSSKDKVLDKYIQFEADKRGVLHSVSDNWQSEVLGSGMLGMPGDSSSVSRFIRAALLRKSVPTKYDSRTGVEYALQLLGRLSVADGEVVMEDSSDVTLWWVVKDHTKKVLYYANRMNRTVRAIDYSKVDFSKGSGMQYSKMSDADWFVDDSNIFTQ